jgi:hypothetical protein
MAEIDETGEVSDAEPIPEEQIEEWVNENPDAEEFFPEPPDWLPEPDPDYFGEGGYEPTAEYEDLTGENPEENPEAGTEVSPEESPEVSPENPPEEASPEPPEEVPPEENPGEPPEEVPAP